VEAAAPVDVLIAGAGPTGLVLALWLTRQGVRVHILDKAPGPGTTSRALAVQARTLELYRQLDLTDSLLELGHQVPGINLWVRGEQRAHVPFATVGAGLTRYPYLEIFPQDQHERLLLERLGAAGVKVERNTELVTFTQDGQGIRAQLRRADGASESCEAAYLAGCDGARSRVREVLGAGFPGGTYRQVFYVADIEASGPPVDGELHIDLDEADFLAVFPLAARGRVRLIGTVRDERAQHAETLKFEDVSHRAMENLKLRVERVNWFSTYRVHHRVAAHFGTGRAFILGDAAHIHSPAGGQGMNTGIGDAVNLAWKLAAVTRGAAPASLLASYEAERLPFAQRLVATTDRVFTLATADGALAEVVRTRLVPVIMPWALSFERARRLLFRTVSQITVNYRRGPLSAGAAGAVHGGDRLPWVRSGTLDNYDSLNTLQWQVHVYGAATAQLGEWCHRHGLALNVFAYTPEHAAAGLTRNALYLLRPDTYLALVDADAQPGTLERFFAERRLHPGAPEPAQPRARENDGS
jgi:2-polyprenyl-6-methoxyphenol hydroxylase-like FAD-dependent oxidoreductase